MSETSNTTVTLTQQDQLRIRYAMTQVPYASPSLPEVGETIDADAIVRFLNNHAEFLNEVTARRLAEIQRHHALLADLAAVRRVFGAVAVTEAVAR